MKTELCQDLFRLWISQPGDAVLIDGVVKAVLAELAQRVHARLR